MHTPRVNRGFQPKKAMQERRKYIEVMASAKIHVSTGHIMKQNIGLAKSCTSFLKDINRNSTPSVHSIKI